MIKNDFTDKLKRIEQEILDLKTATQYSSIRTAYRVSTRVTTGLYKIDYGTDGQAIMSQFNRQDRNTPCYVSGRTPSSNSQIVEVDTTVWDNQQQQFITYENGLVIISNVPVSSVTRIS